MKKNVENDVEEGLIEQESDDESHEKNKIDELLHLNVG